MHFQVFSDVLWTNDCFFFLLLIKKIYDGQSIMNKSLDVALLPAWLEEEEGEEAEKYVFCYKGEQTFKKQPLQQLLHTTIFMSNKLKKYKHVEAPPNLMWGMQVIGNFYHQMRLNIVFQVITIPRPLISSFRTKKHVP